LLNYSFITKLIEDIKKILLFALLPALVILAVVYAQTPDTEYIVIAWNDLGMHCSNKDFSKMAILPP